MSEQTKKHCAHHTPHRLSYLAAHADATERLARGEEQTQCEDCGFWMWPDEMGTAPDRVDVFAREDCTFMYCPNPDRCQSSCVHSLPLEGADDGE